MPFRPVSIVPALSLAVALVVAGCSSGSAAAPSPAPTPAASTTPEPPRAAESMAAERMSPGPTAPSTAPSDAPTPNAAADALAGRAWATAQLTDVATGEAFTIADFAGRTIFVESMAIWCSNCRAQQARFTEALARLEPDSVAYVVLTVDPGESGEDLARYRESQGFSGTYAVAGSEVARALADEFGANAINPPRVPLVLVTPGGEVTFSTGGESVDEIVTLAGG